MLPGEEVRHSAAAAQHPAFPGKRHDLRQRSHSGNSSFCFSPLLSFKCLVKCVRFVLGNQLLYQRQQHTFNYEEVVPGNWTVVYAPNLPRPRPPAQSSHSTTFVSSFKSMYICKRIVARGMQRHLRQDVDACANHQPWYKA